MICAAKLRESCEFIRLNEQQYEDSWLWPPVQFREPCIGQSVLKEVWRSVVFAIDTPKHVKSDVEVFLGAQFDQNMCHVLVEAKSECSKGFVWREVSYPQSCIG